MIKKILNWISQHKLEFIILATILLIGGFLRLYHVGDWMHFAEDEGNHVTMAASIVHGHLVLLGPAAPNNNGTFHLGPFYYYLLAPFVWLWGMSPAGGAWADALFAIASIFLVYLVGKKLINTRTGLIGAALFASSFLMVYYGRWMWNPNFVPFFSLLIILCLYQICRPDEQPSQRAKYLYLLAVCSGLVIQLHGTALMVLPPLFIIYYIIFHPKFSWKQYLRAAAIFLFVNLPYIIYDLTHKLSNTRGFFHVLFQSDSGQSASWLSRIWATVRVWKVFWQEALLHTKYLLAFKILVIACALFLVYKLWGMIRKKKMGSGIVLLALWLLVPFGIFIFYKSFIPTHYFCLVFPLPFLLLAATLDFAIQKMKIILAIGLVVVLLVAGLQLRYSVGLLQDLRPNGSRASSYPLTLSDLRQTVDFIKSDSQGRPFNFSSEPPANYDSSYRYLFGLVNIQPSESVQPLVYVAIKGRDASLPENISPQQIKNTRIFGNVKLLIISQ